MKGILVAEKAIGGKLIYDSRNVRPQIAIDRTPKHLDIFVTPATGIVTNVGNDYYAKETLFSMKHGLKYTPKPLVYFYLINSDRYGVGKYFYAYGAADDYLAYEVDDTYFKIVHVLEDYFHAGRTSTAPTFGNIRVKYMIFSNPIDNLTNS